MWTVLSSFTSVLSYTEQWRIQGRGPGGGGGGAPPPPPPSSYLRVWMIVPSPYLKVWIRHC